MITGKAKVFLALFIIAVVAGPASAHATRDQEHDHAGNRPVFNLEDMDFGFGPGKNDAAQSDEQKWSLRFNAGSDKTQIEREHRLHGEDYRDGVRFGIGLGYKF